MLGKRRREKEKEKEKETEREGRGEGERGEAGEREREREGHSLPAESPYDFLTAVNIAPAMAGAIAEGIIYYIKESK